MKRKSCTTSEREGEVDVRRFVKRKADHLRGEGTLVADSGTVPRELL